MPSSVSSAAVLRVIVMFLVLAASFTFSVETSDGQAREGRNLQEGNMPADLVILGIVGLAWSFVDEYLDRRRIARVMAAVDREWNELLNTHRHELLEALQQGKTVEVRMDRR